jgi:hypothetical protein
VYHIDAWEEPGETDIAVDIKRKGRWGFRGHRDPILEKQYKGGDVSKYFTSQSPLQYFP